MFGIGTTEFLVIMLVAVLVLGPEHLPRIMRTVNKVMSDFRRISTDFQRTINLEASQEELRGRELEAAAAKKKKRRIPAPANPEEAAAADSAPRPHASDTPAAAMAGAAGTGESFATVKGGAPDMAEQTSPAGEARPASSAAPALSPPGGRA